MALAHPDPVASKIRTLLDIATNLASLFVCILFAWLMLTKPAASTRPSGTRTPPLPSEPISLAESWIKGSPAATVGIVEFADFQCPFCSVFAKDILPELDRVYISTGKVLLAFRHLPLPIHSSAMQAAVAAECAGKRDRFWDMHNQLFQDPRSLALPSIETHARSLNLNDAEFVACLQSRSHPSVTRDISQAKALGISGTPTFFLGSIVGPGQLKVSRRISGAVPFAQLQQIIEPLLESGAPAK